MDHGRPADCGGPVGQLVHARVWLTPRNAAQLDALAQAVSDPSNAQYGQFISADQYAAQFAPTADQVGQVTQWLKQSGLSVTATGPDNHFVAVAGSASAISTAFGATLAEYLVNGKEAQAPVADVSVPDSLAGLVTAVTGLSTLGHAVKPADFGAPDAFVNATPCSKYYGEQTARTLPRFQHQTLSYAVCGYTPDQLRGAYGVDGFGNTQSLGRGQTVAITDAYDEPSLLADANTYAMRQGDRPFSPGQFQDRSVPENASTGDDCGGNGWYGEQALDVEAVHGMAPAANVWGYAHPDYPTGDPWVTSVGGTSLAIDRRNNRAFETGWGTEKYSLSADGSSWSLLGFIYGAGGGISQVFPEPAYQRGVVPRSATGRAVPDVAMDADPTTGMLVGETQNFSLSSRFGPAGVHYGEYRIGGTSLASPLFAGAEAVAQANEGGRRIGFADPLIYSLARLPGEFYDVTPQGDVGNVRADFANLQNADGGILYSVRTFDQDSSLTTGRGWDDVTGVGSLTPRYFDWFSDLHR